MGLASSAHSVTEWIAALKEGDDSRAAQQLWQRYLNRLVVLANRKLQAKQRRVVDGDDLAQQAFASFFQGARARRFAKLEDRDDLWQILLMLVGRKAIDQRRRQNAAKHGGGRIRGESIWQEKRPTGDSRPGLDAVDAGRPSPAFAADVAERFRHLLAALDDELLSQIAVAKMEGWTNAEIAVRLELSERSVERKLGLIRRIWSRDSGEM